MTGKPARYRGKCLTEGCNTQKWKQGYCQRCARAAGLIQYPPCATEDCANKARTTRSGALCASCRIASGDLADLCRVEGCTKPGYTTGRLCHAHQGHDGLPQREASLCGIQQCDNKGFSGSLAEPRCTKHFYNPDACTFNHCSRPVARDGKCDKHAGRIPDGTCAKQRCTSPRYKAGLCYRHYHAANAKRCAYPPCTFAVDEVYCRIHDVGVDFAAGDWYDWVAVERLWGGQQGDRKPTVPELKVVIGQAEQRLLPYAQLARQIGVDPDLFERWRHAIARLDGAVA